VKWKLEFEVLCSAAMGQVGVGGWRESSHWSLGGVSRTLTSGHPYRQGMIPGTSL